MIKIRNFFLTLFSVFYIIIGYGLAKGKQYATEDKKKIKLTKRDKLVEKINKLNNEVK